MTIHYQDHERFSQGQGFIGAACRPISSQAKSKRWFAVDCRKCKLTLLGREIVSDMGRVARVAFAFSDGVGLDTGEWIDYRQLDLMWAPMAPGEEKA